MDERVQKTTIELKSVKDSLVEGNGTMYQD